MHPPNQPGEARQLAQEEYRSLRRTVQHRGTLRIVVALLTWCVWAGLATLTWTNGTTPLVGGISLLVLAGGFELVLSLHTGVERVGRYLQVVFESDDVAPPAWEHVAMGMGSRWLSPGGLDPLFSAVFLLAALLNALPTLAAGSSLEIVGAFVIHLAFAIRLIAARQFVGRQRAHDLAALQQAISSNSLVSRIQQER